MAEHGALATLKDLAEKEVEDAARLLGEMRRGCQQAEEQLKMLIDYQNEYRNNLNSDMSAGMTSTMKSCTAPASTTPASSHRVPGR